MKTKIQIAVEYPAWKALANFRKQTRLAVDACAKQAGPPQMGRKSEISLLLCADEKIKELNRNWRGIDKPTNVLSFPQGDVAHLAMLGDIAISFDTIHREAKAEGKTLQDHYTHMVIHGFLHLLGFDHIDQEEALEMEDLERQILASLGVSDPYASADLMRE